MDPLTAMLIAGGLMQGIGGIWGANSQNKANERNQRAMQERYNQLLGFVQPRLNQGPGQGEQMLFDLLQSGGLFDNQAFNTGQDALMQSLRSDPIDTTELFASWEPLEMRALDEALAGAFGQSSGLGQRFGSAMMREEGQVRGQAAEQNTARRAGTSVDLATKNAEMQALAAQILSSLGVQQGQAQMQGLGMLANMGAQRGGLEAQLLSLLTGAPMAASQPSAMPGAFGDIGQLMAFLPMFMQMMQQNKVTA